MKRFFDKAYIVIIAFVIVTFSALLFILPDKSFSEKENRTLAKAPEFTVGKLFAGEYTGKIGGYFADQFPLRDAFIGVKAYSELALGKGENNGVVLAGDLLIPREENSTERLEANLKTVKAFADRTGTEVLEVALPRTVDVFAESLPASYPAENDKAVWDEYFKISKQLGVKTVNVYDILCDSNAYYRTDHHYTTEGAYLTYRALGEALGYTPKDREFFKTETVADDFCGTAMRTSGLYLTEKDEIILFRYQNDMDYEVTADGKEIKLYDFDKLNSTDKYAVFLGGNHARVDIKGEGNREKLLIIRDSFADSIAPFLSLHYDLVMIDLRYYSNSVSKILKEENIDKVLVLECISELATTKNISYLNIE